MNAIELINQELCGYVNQIDYSPADIGGINSLAMSLSSCVQVAEGLTLRLLLNKAQEQLSDAAAVLNHDGDDLVANDMLGVAAYWLGKAVWLAQSR